MQDAPSPEQLHESLTPLVGLAWRVVETQETAATRAITHNAEEQFRLEQLLDDSKPPIPDECTRLSYLLMTPFRYPPLRYGSRFGCQWERGIFYGSKEQKTALAETAVYLWLFQAGPQELGPLAEITDARTLFSVRLRTQQGCDLCTTAFTDIRRLLTQPNSWNYSQQLGSHLREAGAEFFWFPSARIKGGTNAAIINPNAFAHPKPDAQELWNLRLTPELCWFGRVDAGRDESGYYEFCRAEFEDSGRLDHPCL